MKNLKIIIGAVLATAIATSNADGAEVGVLFGGSTKHLSNNFAPNGNYNENNHTIGLEILQDKEGIVLGGSVAKFKDSLNKPSYWLLATIEYKKTFKHVSASAGVGVGKLKTSYYNGLFATPFAKVRHNYTGLYAKVMIQPISNDKVDSFVAGTVGVSKMF